MARAYQPLPPYTYRRAAELYHPPRSVTYVLELLSAMSFTAFMSERLARLGIPAKCGVCGNTNLDELAMNFRGQLHCRQDEENIRSACRKRIGWRVIDASGRVIDTGSGITLRATGDLNG